MALGRNAFAYPNQNHFGAHSVAFGFLARPNAGLKPNDVQRLLAKRVGPHQAAH